MINVFKKMFIFKLMTHYELNEIVIKDES